MRIVLDANMPRSLVRALVEQGHDVVHVRDTELAGATDVAIAEFARSSGRAIITRDLDFADTRAFPPENFAGIVVVSCPSLAKSGEITRLVTEFMRQPQVIELLPSRLARIRPGSPARFRPPPPDAS